MSQREKAGYYRALKDAGVKFDRHYREYNTEELKQAYLKLRSEELTAPRAPEPEPQFDARATAAAFSAMTEPAQVQGQGAFAPPLPPLPEPTAKDPNEMPGQRLNSKDLDEPIRVDELGRIWFQEEVLKPAYPKPRGRRVLDYLDTGAVQKTVTNGQYTETFEVAGDPANARPAQVKITLPSYQVGIYKDPRFPFKVHTYNGNEGFDLIEVENFYGGRERVPEEVKRKYVENVLCYDMRTVVRAIQSEYNQLRLTGKVQ